MITVVVVAVGVVVVVAVAVVVTITINQQAIRHSYFSFSWAVSSTTLVPSCYVLLAFVPSPWPQVNPCAWLLSGSLAAVTWASAVKARSQGQQASTTPWELQAGDSVRCSCATSGLCNARYALALLALQPIGTMTSPKVQLKREEGAGRAAFGLLPWYCTFYIILYHFNIMVLLAGSWRDGPRLFKGPWHPVLTGRMKTVHAAVYP